MKEIRRYSFIYEIENALSAPFLLAALWFSNHLHFKVNENLFRRVVSWIILIGGISLFYH